MANQDLEVGKTHNECISARERLKLKNMNEHTKETQGNEANTLLPAARPAMASEALQLLKEGKEIEIHNETVFELMIYFKKSEPNFKLRFMVNRDNEGWTVVCPNCW